MVRNWILPSAALATLLAGNSASIAADPPPARLGFSGGTADSGTANLLGKGTAATAARAADTEPTWYHGYRRGFYHGFYAGFGYSYGYAVPYAASYPYAVSYYTPAYVSPAYVAPAYAAPAYAAPAYVPPAVGFYGRFGRFALGIGVNGVALDVAAPAIPLAVPGAVSPAVPPLAQPAVPVVPAIPVPMPKPDPAGPSGQAVPGLPAPGLPVSLPKAVPAKPYTYKGYGEK